MKTLYTRAELEIRYFETEDIVTASAVEDPEDAPEEPVLGSANMQGGGTEGIDWN